MPWSLTWSVHAMVSDTEELTISLMKQETCLPKTGAHNADPTLEKALSLWELEILTLMPKGHHTQRSAGHGRLRWSTGRYSSTQEIVYVLLHWCIHQETLIGGLTPRLVPTRTPGNVGRQKYTKMHAEQCMPWRRSWVDLTRDSICFSFLSFFQKEH